MTQNSTTATLPEFLKTAINDRLTREAEVLVAEAKKKLEERTPEIVAGIVVDIMSTTLMQDLKDRVIFEIRKK